MALKLKVGRFNISVSAEDTILDERSREESTCYMLNHLAMILSEAAKLEKYNPNRKPEDAAYLARIYDRYSDEVYQALKKRGFYDDLYTEDKKDGEGQAGV